MEIQNKSVGSGIISLVVTVDDYEKTLKELRAKVSSTPFDVGDECITSLTDALDFIADCKATQTALEFAAEERIKACIYATRDWLATKSRNRFDVIATLYNWKLENFHHRAWDASMGADHCEGILFRLMERVNDNDQNVAVVQIFLPISELESCTDSSIRIETRINEGLQKLKTMVQEKVPMVGIVRTN
jgi:hypothetical protein